MAFWDDVQAKYDRMSPTQRRKRLLELNRRRLAGGYGDPMEQFEYMLFKLRKLGIDVPAKQFADDFRAAIKSGKIRSAVEIDGEYVPVRFPTEH